MIPNEFEDVVAQIRHDIAPATPDVACPAWSAARCGITAPCQCGAPVGTLRAGRCDDCAFDALGGE